MKTNLAATVGLLALLLLVSLMGSLFAAPNQPPGKPVDSPDAMTLLQAKAQYGQPDSIYLDGKGGSFWLFNLKRGQRLMIEVAPQDKPVKRQLLPPSWQPAPGGHVFRARRGALTFIPAPRRSVPPSQPPHDRYHPGVKLLARGL